MPNPSYLLCDADALIQVFVTRQRVVLSHLRQKYGVVPAVMPEVEGELSKHRKFGTAFDADLRKFVQKDQMVVLERKGLQGYLSGRGLTTAAAQQAVDQVYARGRQYSGRVGAGEAYSHAAAVVGGLPLLSHDMNAVIVLQNAGEPVAAPVLRFVDLLLLALEDGVVTEDACVSSLRVLEARREYVPIQFRGLNPDLTTCAGRFNRRVRIWDEKGEPPIADGPKGVLYLMPSGAGP